MTGMLAGLIAKRAELAVQIETAQDELRELRVALNSLDAAIKVFDPAYGREAEARADSFPEARCVDFPCGSY
jgi:CHAD domain-containing protein